MLSLRGVIDRLQQYPILSQILGGEWDRLTHQIALALNSGVLDMDGLDQGLSARGSAIILDAFAKCTNELSKSCKRVSLLSEAVRRELPSLLLEEIERSHGLDDAELPTVRKAFNIAADPGMRPFEAFPPGFLKCERKSSDSGDALAVPLAYELFSLRKLAIKKVRLRSFLQLKGLSVADITSVPGGDYKLQAATFEFDLAAVHSFGAVDAKEFESVLDRVAGEVLQQFESSLLMKNVMKQMIETRRAAWLYKSNRGERATPESKDVSRLSDRDMCVHNIIGMQRFSTLTNADILREPSLKKQLRDELKLTPGDATKASLDRIRKAKRYPLSSEILKKRST